MAMTSPLHKVTDDNLWDAAACTFRRLCMVAHAAFIYEGFVLLGTPATTTRSSSCSYSLPQLHGEDIVAVRLFRRPHRRGDRSRMVLYICANYNTGHAGSCHEHRERLDGAAVEAVLSGKLDETARALRTPGSSGQWLWKLIADGICRVLFLDMCRMNGIPVEPGFPSLPGDVKALILTRLDSANDVAMAECASKELKDLVAEHDADLCQAKYDYLRYRSPESTRWEGLFWTKAWLDDLPNMTTWKKKYIKIRQGPPASMM